jgi:anti-anti-sigma factor
MSDYSVMNGINGTNSGPTARRSLFVDVAYDNGTVTAYLVGPRIGEREATVVANAINAKVRDWGSKAKHLVLDFSEIQFISSLGLGMCIDVRNTVDGFGGNTSIRGLNSHLRELFEMMRLDRLFAIQSPSSPWDTAAA